MNFSGSLKDTLTVAGITADSKTYDGTTTANIHTSNATLVGVPSGEDVTLVTTGVTLAFTDKNVGTGKTVTVSGLTLSGADAAKYTLILPTTTAAITAKPLTITATGVNKVYDSTSNATVTLSSGDKISGDTVTFGYTQAAFDNENVGTGKAVSVSGLSIGGVDAGNYNLTSTTASTTADITTAPSSVGDCSCSHAKANTPATELLIGWGTFGLCLATGYGLARRVGKKKKK